MNPWMAVYDLWDITTQARATQLMERLLEGRFGSLPRTTSLVTKILCRLIRKAEHSIVW